MYSYLLQRLMDANMTKDKTVLEEVLRHLHTMRDTWKKVMMANANHSTEESSPVEE